MNEPIPGGCGKHYGFPLINCPICKANAITKRCEPIEFAEWLSKNEWQKRNSTHPKNIGKYWSGVHGEYKTIEDLYELFTKK